jgi:hypothetical protein
MRATYDAMDDSARAQDGGNWCRVLQRASGNRGW